MRAVWGRLQNLWPEMFHFLGWTPWQGGRLIGGRGQAFAPSDKLSRRKPSPGPIEDFIERDTRLEKRHIDGFDPCCSCSIERPTPASCIERHTQVSKQEFLSAVSSLYSSPPNCRTHFYRWLARFLYLKVDQQIWKNWAFLKKKVDFDPSLKKMQIWISLCRNKDLNPSL